MNLKAIALATVMIWHGLQPNAQVYVYRHNTTIMVSIYVPTADGRKCSPIPLANPAYVSYDGRLELCIASGRYDIVVKP